MKRISPVVFLLGLAVVLGGCRTYDYRLVQPAGVAPVTDKEVVRVRVDPLEYAFSRYKDRLAVRISNPTDDPIALLGTKSYVIDPRGESHPLGGRVIGPHSFTRLLLPPEPISGQIVGAWGPGWGWGPGVYWGYGPYYPYYAPFYDPFMYMPPTATYEVRTPYDWHWGTGPARLRLTYDRKGQTFEQNMEIVREPKQ